MQREEIIVATVAFTKKTLESAEGGHDWWHIYRVWKSAKTIAAEEAVDTLIVELGALLHDIADSKFHQGDETIGPKVARAFLETLLLDEAIILHVENIIKHISFKGGNEKQLFHSKELDVVQDADRLDAMGAIGIARAFNYGGFKNRKIYDPNIAPNLHKTKEEYKHNQEPTINHFYEKLFLLKDRMNTKTGRALAEQRHEFMTNYIAQFYAEWEGSR